MGVKIQVVLLLQPLQQNKGSGKGSVCRAIVRFHHFERAEPVLKNRQRQFGIHLLNPALQLRY